MAKKKIRPLGQILLDIEPYIQEAIRDHQLQWSDWRGLLMSYLQSHDDAGQELYLDNTRPVDFYGHEDDLIKLANKIKKQRRGKK